ncbi:hypothetical protein G6F37_008015 [Rhizopus arrhizus]|nr:hypothetical protein G6F38_007088 [Rhizopus arrhizus]KAG1155997.1 hypothetical protein G6F37_008015 [Rhizopus arrhizus]
MISKELDEAIDVQEPKRLVIEHIRTDLYNTLPALRQDGRTSRIIPKLEPNLKYSNETQYAYLCSDHTDYIPSGFMDSGWGCGYRNCQMLMSFLEKEKQDGHCLLKHVVDITSIQLLIEKAWQEGFDPAGAKQLKNHVFKTRKWIGTTEVYSLLAYLGIRSTIVDFHQPQKDMLDWIEFYFTSRISTNSEQKVYYTHRPPLYLQHQGHSRTVIGIEKLKSGKRNLLLLDPAKRIRKSFKRGHADKSSSLSQNFFYLYHCPYRVDDKEIAKHQQYQILVLGHVENKGYLASEQEREAMKNITSVSIN